MEPANAMWSGIRRSLSSALRVLIRPEITIAVLVIALLIHKIDLMRPAAEGPVSVAVVQHDCAIFALLLLLYELAAAMSAWNGKSKLTQVTSAVIGKTSIFLILMVVLLYAADVFAYNFFATRLYARDIVTFSSQWRGVFSILRSGLHVFTSHPKWKLAADAALILVLLRPAFCSLSDLYARFSISGISLRLLFFAFYFGSRQSLARWSTSGIRRCSRILSSETITFMCGTHLAMVSGRKSWLFRRLPWIANPAGENV